MIFQWDPKKARSNYKKHGVSFEEASTVFADPHSQTFDDPDHSSEETRFLVFGQSNKGNSLVVAHRDDRDSVRIISTRKLTPSERVLYEESRKRG